MMKRLVAAAALVVLPVLGSSASASAAAPEKPSHAKVVEKPGGPIASAIDWH